MAIIGGIRSLFYLSPKLRSPEFWAGNLPYLPKFLGSLSMVGSLMYKNTVVSIKNKIKPVCGECHNKEAAHLLITEVKGMISLQMLT